MSVGKQEAEAARGLSRGAASQGSTRVAGVSSDLVSASNASEACLQPHSIPFGANLFRRSSRKRSTRQQLSSGYKRQQIALKMLCRPELSSLDPCVTSQANHLRRSDLRRAAERPILPPEKLASGYSSLEGSRAIQRNLHMGYFFVYGEPS